MCDACKTPWDSCPEFWAEIAKTAPGVLATARLIDALPGLMVTDAGDPSHDKDTQCWFVTWQLLPWAPNKPIFDYGPHRDAWISTEWLIWYASDNRPKAGFDVEVKPWSPLVWSSARGTNAQFTIRAYANRDTRREALTPFEFDGMLIVFWNDYGHNDLDWTKIPGIREGVIESVSDAA